MANTLVFNKVFEITKKGLGEHSHEVHIVIATDVKDLKEKIAQKPWELNIKDFVVKQLTGEGIIYSDIY